MDVVVFDPNKFRAMYAEFADLSDEVLEMYFNAACLLLDNTKKSPVQDLAERETLLYMLTCHIATLKQQGNTMVGTLTSASQGSVSITLTPFRNANWYNTTQCGAMYWAATAKYRVGIRWYGCCKC